MNQMQNENILIQELEKEIENTQLQENQINKKMNYLKLKKKTTNRLQNCFKICNIISPLFLGFLYVNLEMTENIIHSFFYGVGIEFVFQLILFKSIIYIKGNPKKIKKQIT